MEAIKKTRIKRNGNQLTITLPDTFTAEEADVWVWPSGTKTQDPDNAISNDLLQWPEMTDEELSLIDEKRKHLNAWK